MCIDEAEAVELGNSLEASRPGECHWRQAAWSDFVGDPGGLSFSVCAAMTLEETDMASANVFISYSSDTKRRAEELTSALEGQGIEPWVDFKDLHPGQRWKDELERAIDAAQWLVILVGPEGRTSRWQEAEWSTALAGTR